MTLNMDSEIAPPLHVMFFPLMAPGHTIPILDMAKLFGLQGVKTTIITTPLNFTRISKTIQRIKLSGVQIDVKIIKIPYSEAGLPEGCENLDSITDKNIERTEQFMKAVSMLRQPFEVLLQEWDDAKPDCIVSDMFLPWTTDIAAKYGIPRIEFHGSCFFSMCAVSCLMTHQPHKGVSSDSEPFVVPHLPGDIKMTRAQLADSMRAEEGVVQSESFIAKVFIEAKEAESKTKGVVFNSFYELEDVYVDYYRNVLGKKAWHVGPVSLCNTSVEDTAVRGKQAGIDADECLKWLDSKRPNSVVYVCFGSLACLSCDQLMEIALGIEASEQDFIWVVRKDGEEKENWFPEGFEKRMEGRGLIIRGWAPQVLILKHEAVGGFVTHCGWNSTLEAITSGVTMVTWPVSSSDQIYNEILVTQILKIGVSTGVKQWVGSVDELVKGDVIEKAVKEIMVGEKAEVMRNKAKELGEMARKAVEKDGSSYSDLNALIQELSPSK